MTAPNRKGLFQMQVELEEWLKPSWRIFSKFGGGNKGALRIPRVSFRLLRRPSCATKLPYFHAASGFESHPLRHCFQCTVRRHPLQNVPETYFTPSGQKGCLKAAESFPQDRCNRDRSP